MEALRVGVLGPVTAWLGDREVAPGQPRQRAVLAVLATRANRVVSRGELVDAVWGTHAPATAEGGIYTYVAGLRRVLDPGRNRRAPGTVLLSMGAGYMLKLGGGCLDAEAFERGLVASRSARAAGELAEAERLLREALALWRGSAFAGVPGPFAEAERGRLAEHRTAAAEEHADALLALGRNEEAIPELTVLAAEHPLRERTRGLLMVALYRCGRQAEALGVYREAREVLAAELGISPGVELTRIHQQVLAMDPGLATPDAAKAPVAPVAQAAPAAPVSAASVPARPPVAAQAGEAAADQPGRVPAQIPIEAAGFSGRLGELGRLHAIVPRHQVINVPIVAITGMAGVGKTALAIRFARQVAANFPDGQLYVNLRGFDPAAEPTEPEDALPGFLDALGVPGKDVPGSLEARVGLFRSLVDGKRLLVVLDNAHSAAQVRPLLPASPGSMVVITSRRQLTGLVATEGAVPLPLDVLSDSEAHDLLTYRLGRDRVETEPLAAKQIIRLCGRLPLALSVIAARAATTQGLTLAALAAELRASGADVLDAGGGAATDVRAAFSWSYAQLSEAAARMFRLLSVHPGPDIALAAAASLVALPAADARRTLTELTRVSLLAEPARGRFVLHDLLGAYAGELARGTDGDEEIAGAERRLFAHYLHTTDNAVRRLYLTTPQLALAEQPPGTAPEAFRSHEEAQTWLGAELPVLLATLTHAAARAPALDAYCWQLPRLLSNVLEVSGRCHDHLACQRIAMAAAQRTGDPQALGHAHSGFGYACMMLGDTETARHHLDLALAALTASGDRAAAAAVRSRLAILLEHDGRYAEALEHAREALRLRRAFGNRGAIAHAENVTGWMYARLGQHAEGIRHCKRALDLATETGSRSLAADVLDSLGMITLGMGDHERALEYYRQALAVFREIGYARGAFSALTGIGDARAAAGDPGAARDAWQQALDTAGTVPAGASAQVRDKLRALAEQASLARAATAR